jgi:hypothetical protein
MFCWWGVPIGAGIPGDCIPDAWRKAAGADGVDEEGDCGPGKASAKLRRCPATWGAMTGEMLEALD